MTVRSLKRANSKLKIKDLKLKSLLEITNAINSNLGKKELFRIYQEVLKEQLNIGKLALYILDEHWEWGLCFGISETEVIPNDTSCLFDLSDITEISMKTEGLFASFDVVVPVYHKDKPLAFVLIGDLIEEAIMISPIIKHLPFIQTLTNLIAVAIENKNLARENIKKEKIKKELEFASEMQSMLLPTALPKNNHIEIAAYYQAHQEVGGDYYDFIEINSEELIFCMADVSGKGISAALLMSNFQANLRVLAENTKSLSELVEKLNTKVLDNAKGEKFITFFVGKYNKNNRVLKYINAGHNPPVLINDNTISFLMTGCVGLGMLDFIPSIKEGIINLSKDAVLCCYTDGLIELENDDLEPFELERLAELVNRLKHEETANINLAITEELKTYKQSQNYIDDIAILSCKFL